MVKRNSHRFYTSSTKTLSAGATARRSGSLSWSTIGALLLFATALAPAPAHACGPGDPCEEKICDSIFAPEVLDQKDDAPFFRTRHPVFQDWATPSEEGAKALRALNTSEWASYLGKKVSEKELDRLVYEMPLPNLDALIFSLKGKQAAKEEDQNLARQLQAVENRERAIKALFYLGFAKRCEPIATTGNLQRWEDEEKYGGDQGAKSDELAQKQAMTAEKLIGETTDEFLKRRYAFQGLRMMFYGGETDRAIDFYDRHPELVAKNDSIKYRSMEYAAGSLYYWANHGEPKNYARANFLYSQIFAQFPPLKINALISFHPQEQADWEETLALAKTKEEKAVLWQMFGIIADGETAIQKIHALDPASKRLALLMTRELNKAEEGFFNQYNTKSPDNYARLTATFERVAKDSRVDRPELWHLGLAHLYAISGKTAAAEAELRKLATVKSPSENFTFQLRITRLFNTVRSLKAPDAKVLDSIAGEFEWLEAHKDKYRAEQLSVWGRKQLASLYRTSGDKLRAALLEPSLSPEVYNEPERLDQLIAFVKRKDHKGFDRYLASTLVFKEWQLLEARALGLLYRGKIAEAAKTMAQAPDMKLMADPFLIHIVDNHDYDHAQTPEPAYTKTTLLKRLSALDTKCLSGKGQEAAKNCFLAGNAAYNVTYYGNARDMYWIHSESEVVEDVPLDGQLLEDMSVAAKYYRRALELSSDREFKAQMAFMLAKTELNTHLKEREMRNNHGTFLPSEFTPPHFDVLKAQYADTQYYREVLKECGYFERYVGKKN